MISSERAQEIQKIIREHPNNTYDLWSHGSMENISSTFGLSVEELRGFLDWDHQKRMQNDPDYRFMEESFQRDCASIMR